MLDFLRRGEKRERVVSSSDPSLAELLGGIVGLDSASGVQVTTDNALGVPAIWAAVNFISATLAGLPLNVFERGSNDERRPVRGPLRTLLHDAPNEGLSSFEWRKHLFEQVLTGGRAFTWIERNRAGAASALWPLDPTRVTVKRVEGRKLYEYKEPGAKLKRYEARDVIDLPFMLKADGLKHRGPIATNRDVIGLAIAATNYGSRFFNGGGVPPFVIQGNFQSGAALGRASEQLHEQVRKAAKEARTALTLPVGLEVKPLGADPAKTQFVELQRFLIEQVARIYSIPPTFLQDLSHGTFSNTEQQDLHFVKHTVARWAEQFEQELNLKLFASGRRRFVELNLDGLLRGDFKTRMEGFAQGIQNGILTPNEARRMENRPPAAAGDDLMIQGATVPLGSQPAPGEQQG